MKKLHKFIMEAVVGGLIVIGTLSSSQGVQPRIATAEAQLGLGMVIHISVVDGGAGYDAPPIVSIVGGGGGGATASASVTNGSVSWITINTPGGGYTNLPVVVIDPPKGSVVLEISNNCQVFLRGNAGQKVNVQSISSASQTNWDVITNVTLGSNAVSFLDPGSLTATQRFYRALLLANPSPLTNMVLIPSGAFVMGDTFNDGKTQELPLHTVDVAAFYMDQYEVSKEKWDAVFGWATNHGYSFDHTGLEKANNHPVHTVSWYDAVKWCNARSEMEGRTPAYYTNSALVAVYRSGLVDVKNDSVNWNAGYRLPTEAEWEKAARGGSPGHRFAWSDVDTISHAQANYYSDPSYRYAYDVSVTRGYCPAYATNDYPYTCPVGSFALNGYGLYDMVGNISEWCWDWYGDYSNASQNNPHGPDSSAWGRVHRDGSWLDGVTSGRVSSRDGYGPETARYNLGFRTVIPAGSQ